MIDAKAIGQTFIGALTSAETRQQPYRHWILEAPLPAGTGEAVVALPIAPADIEGTAGKRETNNASRVHFSPDLRGRHAVVDALAEAFQDPDVVRGIERACGVDLEGTYLRIEYCQDQAGFWLEPHTDIGAKRFTMLVYLCEGEGADTWGTDVLDAERRVVARSPCGFNVAMIFVPAENTWHGFEERPIHGVRRCLMLNYVSDEWRSTHELSFPGRPVASRRS